MMTKLRESMHIILWIVVVAFLITIVFSWGKGGFKNRDQKSGVLGEINGEEIQYDNFERLINYKVQNQTAKGEAQPDAAAMSKLREETWDEQVEAVLKMQLAKDLGVIVADREVAFVIENNPPDEVRTAERFQTEGQFDSQKYLDFLRRPEAQKYLVSMEENVRNYLAETKLAFQAAQAVSVSEEEVRDEWNTVNAWGRLRFVVLQFKDEKDDTTVVTDEMSRRYYSLFKDRFKNFAQRRIAYVKFKLLPTHEDSLFVESEANRLLDEIRGGADFAKLATESSQDDATASKGGDLGWFGPGTMAEPFEKAAYAAKVGDLVGPVLSKFGYHVIKVERRKREDGEDKVQARHILLKIEASADTRDQVYNDAYNFSQDIHERGFDEVVAEFNYDIDTTKDFSESGYIAGLGRMRMAAEFCMNSEVGALSEVYPVPDGYVVFKLISVANEGFKPYEEVQGSIRKTLAKSFARQKVIDRAAEIRGRLDSPEELDKVALAEGLQIYQTADSVGPKDALPEGLRRDQDFMNQVFRLKEGELSGVITGKNGCYIAHLAKRNLYSQEAYETSHFAVYQKLIDDRQTAAAKNWVRELRVAADIKDYRYKYYRDF